MMHKKRKRYGFTLVELLLYIGLLGIMTALLGGIGINIFLSKAKTNAQLEVNYNASFIANKLIDVIREGVSINSPNPGATSTTLSLAMASGPKNPTVLDLSGGVLRIQEGSGTTTALSTNGVEITDVTFSNITYSGTSGTVRVEMTITSHNPENRTEYEASETFYITENLRKP